MAPNKDQDCIISQLKDTAAKLDAIGKIMGKQEVILEKISNLESNTKESLERVHDRIDKVEKDQKEFRALSEGEGCTALKLLRSQEETIDAKMMAEIKNSQKRLDKIESFWTWFVRTFFGAVLTGAIATIFLLARTK